MRVPVISIIAILLDPFFILIALIAVSLGYSKNYIIPITGVFIGLLAETLAMKVTQGHQWGDSFPILLATGIIQAISAYFMVGWWRNRKARQQNEDKSKTAMMTSE